ncbi:hypothetical protein WH47_03098 [Habropoda laboriosa]|uniref:Uncharacterized protein n=1 Tax=Habropoda laboriosa TaxID=597456 RepID=A0A0L7QYG8_9HYME|nr:hypothetical protein WH47_03098 [Habropoda laboriosa]
MILACFAYLFLTNHMGQTIMDSSSKLLGEAYSSGWYTASVPAQKTLLYIMQHSIQDYNFSIGGLFVPSYQGFSTVTDSINS